MSKLFFKLLAAGLTFIAVYKLADIGIFGHRWIDYLFYFGLPLAFAGLSVAALRLSRDTRVIVLSCLTTTFACLLIGDIFFALRDINPATIMHQRYIEIWKNNSIQYDARTTLELVRDLRDAGKDALPKLNPRTLLYPVNDSLQSSLSLDGSEIVALGTVANQLSVYCNELGDYLIYQSDRHGFHNPPGIWPAKKLEIVAVGDSFTEGACVPSKLNMIARIREHYPLTINLGMGGNGALLELGSLREYGLSKKPSIVIWFYTEENDFNDIRKESGNPILSQYLNPSFSQNLLDQESQLQKELLRYASRKTTAQEKSVQTVSFMDILLIRHLRDAVRIYTSSQLNLILANNIQCERSLDILKRALEITKFTLNQWSGKVLFVYIPAQVRLFSDAEDTCKMSYRSRVLDVVGQLGIEVLDLTEYLKNEQDPHTLYSLDGLGHFSVKGYQLIGNTILQRLETWQLIPHQIETDESEQRRVAPN